MSNTLIGENPISPKATATASSFSIASLITGPHQQQSDLYDYNQQSFDYQQNRQPTDLLTASTSWFQRHLDTNIKNMDGI